MASIAQDSVHGMCRAIDWKHAFFVAAGVPALAVEAVMDSTVPNDKVTLARPGSPLCRT